MESIYDEFALSRSRTMFAALPGCLGAIFMGVGTTRSVLSLWKDQASIDALQSCALYTETVGAFVSTGALELPQTTAVYEVTGGLVDISALEATDLAKK